MRFRAILSLLGGSFLVGCAKFPPSSSALDATRITFVMNFAGPINPSYIYMVAIKVVTPAVNSNPLMNGNNNGPIPVTDVGSQNGMVAGYPTHYVVYVPSDPNVYQVFEFPLNNNNPNVPVNLALPGVYIGEVLQSNLINPQNPDGSYSQSLGFDIDTRFLDQYTTGPGAVQDIQVNILTANVVALTESEVNERVMDAIGNQSQLSNATFNNPVNINLQNGFTYMSGSGNMPVETSGDTFPTGSNLPSVDMTSWSITVTPP